MYKEPGVPRGQTPLWLPLGARKGVAAEAESAERRLRSDTRDNNSQLCNIAAVPLGEYLHLSGLQFPHWKMGKIAESNKMGVKSTLIIKSLDLEPGTPLLLHKLPLTIS